MSGLMNSRVLVLNKNWIPVDILNVVDAISKVFAGRAKFLDVETCATYNFADWVDNWDDAIRTAKVAADRAISSPRFKFLLPDVIVCTEYRGFGYHVSHRQPKFSRANIYRRDRNMCQMCGKKFHTEDLTIDHVIPRKFGGPETWENLVCACVSCNTQKGDQRPEQAGLKLRRQPKRPNNISFIRNFIGMNDHRWKPYLFAD